MRLKALEMRGFKSFPDKTIFNFNRPMTAVVGPNGSGKSNIADAVRWVLGEQSTKNLRGSRMEDVIFGGTSKRKPLGFAEVTLVLENKDRTLNDYDKDEVSVTRRYYRSGESEYMLNGETVRLRDIHELFMDTGLGRDGYSLVSQGRVADLISSKSGQRREMLEEAAGISHYRYRRNDATKKLDQAEDNLIRLRDILSELESRVGPLKTQSEKAQKFLVLAEERKGLEIGLWLHTIDTSKQKLITQEEKLSIAQAQYDTIEAKLNVIEKETEDNVAKTREINEKIDFIRDNASGYEEQAVLNDGKIDVQKTTIEHNRQTIERIRRDMTDASNSEKTLSDEIALADSDIAGLNAQKDEKNRSLEVLRKEMSALSDEDSGFADKVGNLTAQISGIAEKISEKKIEESTANSSIDEVRGRVSNIEGILSTKNSYVDGLQQQCDECAAELEELNKVRVENDNAVAGFTLKVRSKSEKAQKLKEQIDTGSLEIMQKKDKLHMLDEMVKNMDGFAGAVKQVIKRAEGGALKGIHGTLSQLINVDEQYAVAVETALGNAVQNIVTDSENDAKRAINMLKDGNSGRATFLPLTSVTAKPFTEKGLEDCYGFVDMADALLDYDPKYDQIIKSLLGRTAVAEDLDCAIAIAKKYGYRFKIVTLDGQVVNAGGSMTGGSRGHGAGFLSRTNEMEKIKEELAVLTAKQEIADGEYKVISEELSAARASLDGAEAELKRTQEDIIRKESAYQLVSGKFDTAKATLDDLRREKKDAGVRIADLEKISAAAREEIDALNRQTGVLQAQLEDVNRDRELTGDRRAELASKEATATLEILAIDKDIEAREEAKQGLQRRMESHEGKLDDLNGEIAGIEKEIAAIEENIKVLEGISIELRGQSSQAKKDTEALINERTACENQAEKLRTDERALNADREKISGELARLEERKESMQKALDDAVNKLFDEYQLTMTDAREMNIVIEDYPAAQRQLSEVKGKIRALGSVNVDAIDEYKEVSERYNFMKEQLEDIEKSKSELIRLINELTGKMGEQFKEKFISINAHFGETFAELFNGGKAELRLEDLSDPLECNIEIKVQPPGKNVQNIDLLSGGEKGLAAIALLFAILKVSPSPFCIFDEVEAALDDVNVGRYARYVRRMTGDTQFILITHRRGTMEEADVLYGITMQEEGVSRMLELRTAEMAKELGLN